MGLSRRFQLLYPFVCERTFNPVFVIQTGEADWCKKRGNTYSVHRKESQGQCGAERVNIKSESSLGGERE